MERMMIGSLQLNSTTTGKQVAELFSNDTRLQYPVLRLFDLSELLNIGLDPNEIQPGQTVHRRFWAYYEQSDTKNQRGVHYKDVQYLEPIDTPASATSPATSTRGGPDTSALLDELRRIRIHLEAILRHLTNGQPAKPKTVRSVPICPTCHTHPCLCNDLPDPNTVGAVHAPPTPPSDPTLRYPDGSEVSDNEPEIQAYTAYLAAEHKPPSDVDALRAWVLDTAKAPSAEGVRTT